MKINHILPRVKQQLGFTMIELLIVIAILGILAVAVLSAINPIEQINRGRDTGSRSDAEQLISAIDRFYAMKGYYPWQTGADDAAAAIAWVSIDSTTVGTNTTCPILYRLSDIPAGNTDCTGENGAQELKAGFVNKIDSPSFNDLYIYNAGGGSDSTYVCFAPKSNSFKQEAKDRLDLDGDNTYPDTGAVPADYPIDGTAYNNPTAGAAVNCGDEGVCVCLP